jgi:hypothetical protein
LRLKETCICHKPSKDKCVKEEDSLLKELR